MERWSLSLFTRGRVCLQRMSNNQLVMQYKRNDSWCDRQWSTVIDSQSDFLVTWIEQNRKLATNTHTMLKLLTLTLYSNILEMSAGFNSDISFVWRLLFFSRRLVFLYLALLGPHRLTGNNLLFTLYGIENRKVSYFVLWGNIKDVLSRAVTATRIHCS